MIERPINFSAEMVQAILEGRKSQTRRVINSRGSGECFCPYGKPGDVLYVRESLQNQEGIAVYARDLEPVHIPGGGSIRLAWAWKRNRLPAMFMPRLAARMRLRITDVRTQHLQQISLRDAVAEGASGREEYADIWDKLNAERGYPWERDAWVWALTFEVVKGEET
jgi:hypothetical protein